MYICDDAYRREEVIAMETSILQTLGFDINIPIPYRFLRRYAKVCVCVCVCVCVFMSVGLCNVCVIG